MLSEKGFDHVLERREKVRAFARCIDRFCRFTPLSGPLGFTNSQPDVFLWAAAGRW